MWLKWQLWNQMSVTRCEKSETLPVALDLCRICSSSKISHLTPPLFGVITFPEMVLALKTIILYLQEVFQAYLNHLTENTIQIYHFRNSHWVSDLFSLKCSWGWNDEIFIFLCENLLKSNHNNGNNNKGIFQKSHTSYLQNWKRQKTSLKMLLTRRHLIHSLICVSWKH